MEPSSFQWSPVPGQWTHIETQEVPSEHLEALLHCEGGNRVLAQATQIGFGVPFVIHSVYLNYFTKLKKK